ncbi:DNA-binding SARP family transcriptional activator/tetratricopeptide (TPR) repeat protein [Catenulispora sp. GAS73]|uniref:AfsR/SARP family transcriptional regulator n=1 Tax=Catenulispora sp. GAS73 TaxID=3156269 RepID=UPI003518F685
MLEIRLLGPVEAWAGGDCVPLAPLERDLVAILALSCGTVLSTDRIIDGLWGGRPPVGPRSRVQGLVSTVRRKLGGALVTRHPGYLLDLPREASDLGMCEEYARRARRAENGADGARWLRQALDLWRGAPLDGVWAPGTAADRVRLSELRIGLLEQYFEAELGLGRHAEVVGDLAAAVSADPLRERLVIQFMTALYRCNRQADAIRAYQVVRERLADELGADPCLELRELHMRILRGGRGERGHSEERAEQPSTTASDAELLAAFVPRPRASENPVVPEYSAIPEHPAIPETPKTPEPVQEHHPAQMPAGAGHFFGREADLATLTAALPGPDDEPQILVVSGAGGLGKTALVVRWAHSVARRFPDGQIFIRLGGASQSAGQGADSTEIPSAGSVLGTILLALGVGADRLPVSAEERAATYRTLAHGKRILIVADDVQTVGQLLPLVPPTPGSLLVATSRTRLTALAIQHAVRTLTVEPLAPAAASQLMRAIVGADRLSGEGADEVVRLCGGWPLAIRIAGATLASRSRQSLVSFADELAEGVDVLSVADDARTVRAALAEAHAGLDPAAMRLFGQLGLLPGASACLQLAAAVAGVSAVRARQLLDQLISANLVVETGSDRYWFHDMVLRYARQCGATLPDREVVQGRIVRWYLQAYEACANLMAPERDWPASTGPDDWLPFRGDDPSGFLAAEAPSLPAVARWVVDTGDGESAWRLAAAAYASDPAVPAQVCAVGLEAAVSLGDPRVLGEAHAQLGTALLADPLQWGQADIHLTRATELLASDSGGLACAAAFGLGALRARQSRLREAGAALERALRTLSSGREPLAYAIVLLGYADVLVRSGAEERGRERFAQALILCEVALGGGFDQGRVLLDRPFNDGLLAAELSRALESLRPAVPDRVLAGTLIRLGLRLRLWAAELVEVDRNAETLRLDSRI